MDFVNPVPNDQRDASPSTSVHRPSPDAINSVKGDTSEKGFYDPLHFFHPFNTSTSLAPSLPFFAANRPFPGSSSQMSHNESPPNPPGLHNQNSPTSVMQVWNHPEHHDPHGSAQRSRPLFQSNPPLFGSGAMSAQSHLQPHSQDPRLTPGNPDPSAPLTQQMSQSHFPVSSLPTQFASGPLYTLRDGLTGQYVSSSHPSVPFRNPPPQSYMYPGYHSHSLDSGTYSPNVPGYFSVYQQHPQAYFPQQPAMEAHNPAYRRASRSAVPGSQALTDNLVPPHSGSYRGQQYPLHIYSSPSPLGFAQQHQPNMYQWYFLQGSSAPHLNTGAPIQSPQYPLNYSLPSRLSLDIDTSGEHIINRPLTPDPKPVGSSASSSVQDPTSLTARPPEDSPAPSSPAIEPNGRSTKTIVPPAHTPPVQERNVVRRHYHPNPPRNRSEWVMWVGNVPNDATHDELWRFLKQPHSPTADDADDDGVISIFLISRSSCAFINYQSEEHLNRAIVNFNGRQLRPHDRRCPRFVCRARRKEDDLRAGVGAQRGVGVHTEHVKKLKEKGDDWEESSQGAQSDPNPARSSESEGVPQVPLPSSDEETAKSHPGYFERPNVTTRSSSSYASTTSSLLSRHFPKRFFILKSLSQDDLDLSVERGVWATQKHNEAILDQAFRTSKEVFLIFGVNKSGEFYGYARMTSRILRSEYSISWTPRGDSSSGSSDNLSGRVQACNGESDDAPTSPYMFTSPSENRVVEESPLPVVTSPGERSAPNDSLGYFDVDAPPRERQSAPAALYREQLEFSPGVPPPTSHSCGPKDLAVPRPSRVSNDAAQGTLRPSEMGRQPMVRSPARSKVEASGSSGMALQTVAEEVQANGVEEDYFSGRHGPPDPPQSPEVQLAENQNREVGWGETFKVEWLSTERVPFHRVRHLRNPWNHDREIKVSRDGTELEPGVGQELIEQWSALASETAEGDSGRMLRSGKRGVKSAATPAPHSGE